MKQYNPFAWMMAIAIAGTMTTACSLDGYEPEKPFTTCPEPGVTLYACCVNESGTRSSAESFVVSNILFSEDDIEWFDVNTRELRFRDTMAPLKEQIPLLHNIAFYLGGEYLFSGGATYVGLICSQVFLDLVLCQGRIEEGQVIDDCYYLQDCYPLECADSEEVKNNLMERTAQWEKFTKYLESKGKLRK